MFWIVFEAALALAVLLGIVGWTLWSRRPEPPSQAAAPSPADAGTPPAPR
jgi:hypothetical protein